MDRLPLIQVEELSEILKESSKGTLYSEVIPTVLDAINTLPEEDLVDISVIINNKLNDRPCIQ